MAQEASSGPHREAFLEIARSWKRLADAADGHDAPAPAEDGDPPAKTH